MCRLLLLRIGDRLEEKHLLPVRPNLLTNDTA
jgi:hypothetical protein